MNLMETGLYTATVVALGIGFAIGHGCRPALWSWIRCMGLGGFLGFAFWVRNDAVFLMAAVGLAHLATANHRVSLRRRLTETVIIAGAAAAVSAPWLLYNLWGFGSLVPISGLVHLGPVALATNVRAFPVALFEYLTLLASFEFSPLRDWGPFVAVCATTLALIMAGITSSLRRCRWDRGRATVWLMPAFFGVGLLSFYVLCFDAPHFLRRYLFPASPFLALLWGACALRFWRWLTVSRWRLAGPVLLGLLLGNFLVRDGLTIRSPWPRDASFRNVEWVENHLTKNTWVGAFQSGTLGFFHDRTLNLDGKVNPEALAAIEHRRHQAYVVDSPVQVVVDWASIVGPWSRSDPIVLQHFKWVLVDSERNFAVLRRRAWSTLKTRDQGG